AVEVGVGPEVTAFVPEEGWLVARFIDGSPISLDEMRRPEALSRVAGALRAFHDAAPIPGRFDPWAVVVDYRATAEANGVVIPAQFVSAQSTASRIRAARGPSGSCPATTTCSTRTSSMTAPSGLWTGNTPG